MRSSMKLLESMVMPKLLRNTVTLRVALNLGTYSSLLWAAPLALDCSLELVVHSLQGVRSRYF